ncbi:MAG: protein-L-isoaspartate O-methyltransferase [Candidatus Aenigmarchaeota archaeon]|nr:protein-L-isoaspartate O-methyltransferase [Candidatus Aenigmarchaeota archaeon]
MDAAKNAKDKLIEELRSEGYIKSGRVLEAFKKIDRAHFVLDVHKKAAYSDYPLPIPGNATISAPHMHAIQLGLIRLKENDDVLEVGFGSGILLAYISQMTAGRIVGTEINKETFDFGKKNLERAGFENITLLNEDAIRSSVGKFDKIVVSAAAKSIPKKLIDMLKDGGLMIIPVGEYLQRLFVLEKKNGKITRRDAGGVAFVPLTS